MTDVILCPGWVKETSHGPKLSCLCKLESPGIWSVTQFLLINGLGELTIHRGEVWQYDMNIHAAIITQSGAVTFKFE